jgi:hypothetical protein
MRVRVWIGGAEGPSRDFELATAPQVGECISIAVGGRLEEGIVTSVTWQLVGVEQSGADMTLGIEPVGSVTLVHVICQSPKTDDARANERASAEHAEAT